MNNLPALRQALDCCVDKAKYLLNQTLDPNSDELLRKEIFKISNHLTLGKKILDDMQYNFLHPKVCGYLKIVILFQIPELLRKAYAAISQEGWSDEVKTLLTEFEQSITDLNKLL